MIATLAAAVSSENLIGRANSETLKSIKYQLDVIAGFAFREIIQKSMLFNQVAISEAKDEFGENIDNPLKVFDVFDHHGYNFAVDVVDGTTLAAFGLPGAYSLTAAAKGLKKFPNLQAYAVMAPKPVLEQIDFFKKPEFLVPTFVKYLASYLGKMKSDLFIVTHSFDTGNHHKLLIEKLLENKVKVEIPDPVIVESPYMISGALQLPQAPDAMIGVFGLPEIVINTLLLGILNREHQINFRIASNELLSDRESITLDRSFDFSNEELEILNSMDLNTNEIYHFDNIAKERENAFFVATALTNDPLLKLRGIKQKQGVIQAETIICGFNGSTFKMTTKHGIPNKVDYTARFSLKIDDISLVAIIKDDLFLHQYEEFIKRFNNAGFTNQLRFETVKRTEDNCGPHVTLFEFGVHYGGYKAAPLRMIHKKIQKIIDKLGDNIFSDLKIFPKKILRTDNAIVIEVQFDNQQIELLKKVKENTDSPSFFNVNRIPAFQHITLCRFTEYLTKSHLEQIDIMLAQANEPILSSIKKSMKYEIELLAATRTPFKKLLC